MLAMCKKLILKKLILNQVKGASHFVKVIVACPHRLPKLPESTLCKQARPNNGSLFCRFLSAGIFITKYNKLMDFFEKFNFLKN
jgi:hypothetical protein